jgi:hypothetical protein
MGTWGTAISSNDTYADIYSEFFDLYNDGLDVAEISKKLISNNQETISDTEDSNNFWFALAKAKWECKQLDKELFYRISEIVETGADLEVWRQLDAGEKDIKKRKVILDKFLIDLKTERPKAKPIKKKIIRKPLFEKGDCLTFVLENGNYCGAIVLEAIKDTELGINLIATIRLNQKRKPAIADFENSEVLIISLPDGKEKVDIGWYYPISLKRDNIKFEVAGNINIESSFNPNDYSHGFYYGGSCDWAKQKVEKQLKFEESNPKPKDTLSIEKMLKKKQSK